MITAVPVSSSVSTTEALGQFYRARRILVAGANGFIGTNLVHALHLLGAQVSSIVRGRRPHQSYGTVLCGDLRDKQFTSCAIQGQSLVFDLAGTMGAVDSNSEPVRSLDEDLRAQLTLLAACADLKGPVRLIFPSSRLVYGKPQYLPVDELHPLAPQSMYAVHKLTVEQYLSVLSQHSGLSYTVLRLSNPYGPHQPTVKRSYGVINTFLMAAASRKPIMIYGDGQQKRDYIHVHDVVVALLMCPMYDTTTNCIFNLGGRVATRIGDVAKIITDAAGGTGIRFAPGPMTTRRSKPVITFLI